MKETDIKYLAGLLDADGSIFFQINKNYLQLIISLDLSTGIDKDMKYTNWLCKELEVNAQVFERGSNAKGVKSIKITVKKTSTLEKLIPRINKYLVIKGKHLDRMYKCWKENKGRKLSDDEAKELKEFGRSSRKDTGPIKTKSWLPKAYVSGFIDGDGSYFMKKSSGTYKVSTVSHIEDRQVADLLLKQYGGYLTYQEDWVRWHRALGRTNKSFAIPFLKDMCKHSRLKKWKIEQFLNYHSQRLSDKTPAGEAIV